LTLGIGLHGESGENLIIDWQTVGSYLVGALVVWALDDSVLGQFLAALQTERVTTR